MSSPSSWSSFSPSPVARAAQRWYKESSTMVAVYPYTANGDYQLSFGFGDLFEVDERTSTWLKGKHVASKKKGIVPANYFFPKSDPALMDNVMRDLNQVFIEWAGLLQEYYRDRRMSEFKQLKEQMKTLISWHNILTSPHITGSTLNDLKTKVVAHIEEGRRLLGLDLLVKTADGSEIATEKNTNIVDLYRMHREIATGQGPVRRAGEKPTKSKRSGEDTAVYGITLQQKILMCPLTEPVQIFWSLYSAESKSRVSEEWVINLTKQGLPENVEKLDQKTMFKGVPASLISGGSIYLVARILRKGYLTPPTKPGKSGSGIAQFRRPFAGALLNLSGDSLQSRETERKLVIYQATSEAGWVDIAEQILKDQNVAPVPKSVGITIALQLVSPNVPAGDGMDITPMLFMPETVMEERHDFYVTLDSADLVAWKKEKGAKNCEICVEVRDPTGNVIPKALLVGSGTLPVSEYTGLVLFHTNSPRWNETFCIRLPLKQFARAHVFFTLRQCTEKKGKEVFGHAHMPLTIDSSGTVQADGVHALSTYKLLAPSSPSYLTDETAKTLRKGEVLRVRTLLCSTSMSQNASMVGLLQWESGGASGLSAALRMFQFVDRAEIIKFLPETIAALFAMLANVSEENEGTLLAVYDALCDVIGRFINVKLADAREVLDRCLQAYTAPSASSDRLGEKELAHFIGLHRPLLRCMNCKMARLGDGRGSSKLNPTLKALAYLMKLVIGSHQRHPAPPASFKGALFGKK